MEQKNAQRQPTFAEVSLGEFIQHNPNSPIHVDGNLITIASPWEDDGLEISFSVTDVDLIQDLNHLTLPFEFAAIFHRDKNLFEFIFTYVHPTKEPSQSVASREFVLHFEGQEFSCKFAEPTDRLMRVAKAFRRAPGQTPVHSRNLAIFRDVQTNAIPEQVQHEIAKLVPRSFFVASEAPIDPRCFVVVARHLNFLMDYYDRKSPEIEIVDRSQYKPDSSQRHRFIEAAFPRELSVPKVDEFFLRLLDVARKTSDRQSFLYYYQVLEYAGYYYTDDKVRSELRRFIRDPAAVSCSDEKISELFEIVSSLQHNDDVKMQKVIETYCDPATIWKEIEHNKAHFTSKISFDGGFELEPLISSDTTLETWRSLWTPKIFQVLTKIRNSIVHARERRQNRVILPTHANEEKINRYRPVIARMADQIAFRS